MIRYIKLKKGVTNGKKNDDEFKKRFVNLHLEEGRSVESIKKEYNLFRGILNK